MHCLVAVSSPFKIRSLSVHTVCWCLSLCLCGHFFSLQSWSLVWHIWTAAVWSCLCPLGLPCKWCRCNHTTNFAVLMVGHCPSFSGKSLRLLNFFAWLIVSNSKISMAIQGHRCTQARMHRSLKCPHVLVSALLQIWQTGQAVPKLLNSQTCWQVLAPSDTACGCAQLLVQLLSREGLAWFTPLALPLHLSCSSWWSDEGLSKGWSVPRWTAELPGIWASCGTALCWVNNSEDLALTTPFAYMFRKALLCKY